MRGTRPSGDGLFGRLQSRTMPTRGCAARAAVLLSFFVALGTVLAVGTTPVSAQTVPSSCNPTPGAYTDCSPLLLTPYTYLGNHSNLISQRVAENDFEIGVGIPGACEASDTWLGQGWVPDSVPPTYCAGGGCGSGFTNFTLFGGGGDEEFPVYFGDGREASNWYLYQYGGPNNPPSCNNGASNPTFLLGTVRRDRNSYCPAGFYFYGNYCAAHPSYLDVMKNLGAPCPACGNPIGIATGNKFERELDYQGAGDFPLKLERFYNSLAYNNGESSQYGFYGYVASFGEQGLYSLSYNESDNPFWSNVGLNAVGQGWRHSYQRAINALDSSNSLGFAAFVYRPDGRVYTFWRYNGAFVPPADVADQLTQLADGGFQYRDASNDELETYDATGRLLSIQNRAGETQTMSYNEQGWLSQVTDAYGHSLTFQYGQDSDGNPAELLVSVTDPSGATIQYGYSQANLTTVTYQDGSQKTYQYSGGPQGIELTGIIDESAQAFATFGYDATTGLATLTQHGTGSSISEQYSLNFNYRGADYETSPVTVTDGLGTARSYGVTSVHGVAKVTQVTQPAPSGTGTVSSFTTYDSNGNPASVTDFNGYTTCYTFDETRNLETQRVEALSGGSCPGTATGRTRTTATTWNPNYREPLTVAVYSGASASGTPLRLTTYAYDANGNMLTKTVTDTTVTPNTTRVWTYTYDANGRVLTVKGPRTDVSDLTTYAYYPCTTGGSCGQLHTVTNALGQVTTYTSYNAHGQPLTLTDPNRVVTTLTYDARQRLTSR